RRHMRCLSDWSSDVCSSDLSFYFSYNSILLKRDSLVTLSAQGKTVRQILDLLFRGTVEYKENGNYIILRRAPPKTSEITIRADRSEERRVGKECRSRMWTEE